MCVTLTCSYTFPESWTHDSLCTSKLTKPHLITPRGTHLLCNDCHRNPSTTHEAPKSISTSPGPRWISTLSAGPRGLSRWEHLVNKQKELSWDPQVQQKKLTKAVCVPVTLAMQRARSGGFLEFAGYWHDSRIKQRTGEQDNPVPLALALAPLYIYYTRYPHTHTHMYINTHIHSYTQHTRTQYIHIHIYTFTYTHTIFWIHKYK